MHPAIDQPARPAFDLPTLPSKPHILVVRACRAPQFACASVRLKEAYPGARLTALARAPHCEDTSAAGADDVVAHTATRFGLLRSGWRLVRDLRARRFDAIAVAQMAEDITGHANVYRFVAALAAPIVIVVPFDRPAQSFDPFDLLRLTAKASVLALARRWDTPLMLGLVAVAALKGIWHRARATSEHHGAGRARQRVLHIITTLGVGGAQVQLAELVDRTPVDQFDVEILVLGRADGTFSAQRFARTDIRMSYLSSWPALAPAVLEVASLCRRGRFDIVHTWLFYANVIGAAGARLAGVPFIVSGVRNLSLWKRQWTAQWWFRLGDILAARIPDALTVNATRLVADHQWWARTRRLIAVIPNGLSPSRVVGDAPGPRYWLRQELGVAADVALVGTVGRLAPEKDQALFLKTLAAVRREGARVHGVIVGDGECGPGLRSLAAELGLQASVTFMGRRSDSRRIIGGLDVFVLSSQSEGFPNVLLEAAFLGTPAISTDVAGASDVLDHPDDLFPAGDVATASSRLLARLANPDAARTRANAVRTRAYRLFTADKMAACWLAIYPTPSHTV